MVSNETTFINTYRKILLKLASRSLDEGAGGEVEGLDPVSIAYLLLICVDRIGYFRKNEETSE